MKKPFKVILIAVTAIVVVSFSRDFMLKTLIAGVASQVIGTKVEIGGFSLSLLGQSVGIRNLRVHNPQGFPKGLILDLPRAAVELDVSALLRGRLHLSLLEIELKELGLVKNKEGKLNVDSLKIVEAPKEKKERKPEKQLALQIDIMNLQMGKVVMKDYSVGKESAVKVYEVNLKKAYKNITSASQLAVLILAEPMKAAGIKGASIYGAALLTGVGFIPVAIVATFAGKDSVQ
ncbi:MAG: AsmA family protein, partial [Candidatus Omnitrophica bacterium]|nr:AsmA family protein [Candidatus Omnitrophota bacterium]